MVKFNNFNPNLRFTYESNEKSFSFLDLVITVSNQKLKTALHIKIDRVVESTKCGKKRCEVWVNVSETNTFSSNVICETYKINHKLNCDDDCLIYLSPCKYCGKQYVGETSGSFRYRWNNYKDNDRKHSCYESCMQKTFV